MGGGSLVSAALESVLVFAVSLARKRSQKES